MVSVILPGHTTHDVRDIILIIPYVYYIFSEQPKISEYL